MASRRKIVLVTGHGGYLGADVARELVRCGHRVVGLDLVDTQNGTGST